jgi:hypothetical protein
MSNDLLRPIMIVSVCDWCCLIRVQCRLDDVILRKRVCVLSRLCDVNVCR